MSEPIVFISRNRIPEGKLDEFKQFFRKMVAEVEEELPGTLAHLAYADEGGSEVTIVHIFPNPEAMGPHMKKAAVSAQRAAGLFQSLGLEIYGRPSDQILETMKKIAASGVPFSLWPDRVGGYLRLSSE
jgi:quinol monooxygenase YgiN